MKAAWLLGFLLLAALAVPSLGGAGLAPAYAPAPVPAQLPESTPSSGRARIEFDLSAIPPGAPARAWLPLLLRGYQPALHCPTSDEFDAAPLGPWWSWVNEDATTWSLAARPGYLRIVTGPGSEVDRNLLLQPRPPGQFELRTHFLFSPNHNFQAAGIVLYQDSQNYLLLSRAYCDVPGICEGNGIYFDRWENGVAVGGNFAAATSGAAETYLTLVRRGDWVTGYYSEDNVLWYRLGTHTVSPGVDLSMAGLAAGQDVSGASIPADFDYFRVVEPLAAADLIFYNGTIVTEGAYGGNGAIGIRAGKVWVSGATEGVMAFRGPDTKVVDLGGRALAPGFVDAHTHLLNDAGRWGLDVEAAQELALRNGITTLGNLYTTPTFLSQMQELELQGKLRVRTSLYLSYNTNCGVALGDWYKSYPPTGNPGEMLRIGGVKVFLDGGSCGCPAYSFNHPTCGNGDLWFTQAEANAIVAGLQAAGYQVALHALGDRAVEQALNAIESGLAGGPNSLRHRIEHNALIRDDLLPRYGPLGVVALIFGNYPCEAVAYQLPPEYQPWEWRWRDLLDANPGLHVAWHSDAPFAPVSPLKNLYSMVTAHETNAAGTATCDDPTWLTKKTVTLDQALRMMTSEGAYALCREEEVGSLHLGKYADLVILSAWPQDVDLEPIKDIEVLMTMVGGKTKYCAAGYESLCP